MRFSLLLKTAIGDAYGAGFEYASAGHVLANNTLAGYVRNEKHSLVPGHYTDDTQMALAIAEAIIWGAPMTRGFLAEIFVTSFKRDVREGYARGFFAFLNEVTDGREFLARMKPNSDKSGGAMRAVPLGIYPTITQVKELSALQAAITHDTPDGINAAVAASLMGHYFLYNLGPKKDLGTFLKAHVEGDWDTPWSGSVGQKGWMSVRAAITAVINNSNLADMLRDCIAFTGDVDTVAAIALGAAAASPEVDDNLPAALFDGLENDVFGRDYLVAADLRLEEAMLKLRQAATPVVSGGAAVVSGQPAADGNPLEAAQRQTLSPERDSRILVVQVPPVMFGDVEVQAYLTIPADMDVSKEEQEWFAAGGYNSPKTFSQHLISRGATPRDVEVWNIRDQI
jgi:ADP-ribosyl-[dinitrogen reductase] hydrolase